MNMAKYEVELLMTLSHLVCMAVEALCIRKLRHIDIVKRTPKYIPITRRPIFHERLLYVFTYQFPKFRQNLINKIDL